jgi:TIR domain
MADSVNRPKVFLSHSSIDKPFVNKLYEDLRKCKIDAWLDSEEIRDGRSWLKVIFQDGIPACDALMVYLTENSIKSKMVEKELDAAILHQLDDGGVVVLPYVSAASVRDQLRADLRTLHCRVWNEQNYQEILPSVVAEIWHSYLERVVETAVLKERNRRLELELENQQLKQAKEQTIFTQQEEKDFDHIRQVLATLIQIRAIFWRKVAPGANKGLKVKVTDVLEISSLELLILCYDDFNGSMTWSNLQDAIVNRLKEYGYPVREGGVDARYGETSLPATIITKLQTFGLLGLKTKVSIPALRNMSYDLFPFAEKMFRFKYWLTYNDLDSESLNIKYIGRTEQEETDQDD